MNKNCKILFTSAISVVAVILLASTMPIAEAWGVSIVGEFTGKFDHKTLNAEGEFLIRNDKHTFTITGDWVFIRITTVLIFLDHLFLKVVKHKSILNLQERNVNMVMLLTS